MKKIPTMFERDWNGDRSRVIDKPHPECGWVFAGEGVATRKYDGMCCMFDGTTWYKRREVRADDVARKGFPAGFIEADRDPETLKIVGWVPIGDGPEDRYMREAIQNLTREDSEIPIGTYEFLGPKSQGNAENLGTHWMWPHEGATVYDDAPRTFSELREWLSGRDIEGLVFHHFDGRMAKIKLRDFGLKRGGAL